MKNNLLKRVNFLNQTTIEALSHSNERKIIQLYAEAAFKIMDADYGFVWTNIDKSKFLKLAYVSPSLPYKPLPPRPRGSTQKVMSEGRPLFIDFLPKNKFMRRDADEHVKSLAVIPIVYKKNIYGSIYVCYKEMHRFTAENKSLAKFIGKDAAQVLTIQKLHYGWRDFKNRMDHTLDSVFIFDSANFKIEYANAGAEKLLGFSFKEFLQKKFSDILHWNKSDLKRKLSPLTTKNQESLILETNLNTKNRKKIPVELFIQLSKSLDGSDKFLSIVHDITLRKKVEKDSLRLLRQRDEFFNIASHELRTPVTTIKGFSQILSQRLKKSDKNTHYFLRKINLQVDKLSNLINDLLDISRIDRGKLKFETRNFELNELIRQTIANLKIAITNHPIYFKSREQFWVHGDNERIERVLINLITNAAKYSPEGASVKINLKKIDDDVKVEVEDFGFGISKKDKNKIFNRFYSASGSKKLVDSPPGLGLGLYIANAIVKLHGGNLDFLSKKPGQGSIFYFTLPYYKYRISLKKLDD